MAYMRFMQNTSSGACQHESRTSIVRRVMNCQWRTGDQTDIISLWTFGGSVAVIILKV